MIALLRRVDLSPNSEDTRLRVLASTGVPKNVSSCRYVREYSSNIIYFIGQYVPTKNGVRLAEIKPIVADHYDHAFSAFILETNFDPNIRFLRFPYRDKSINNETILNEFVARYDNPDVQELARRLRIDDKIKELIEKDDMGMRERYEVVAESLDRVLLVGPTGTGKTTWALQMAEKLGLKAVKVDVGLITEPEEFFGVRTIKDGDIHFELTPFGQALLEGGYLIILDEINRAKPAIVNALLPILDGQGVRLHGYHFNAANKYIATMNENGVGTYQVDEALESRFEAYLEFEMDDDFEKEILREYIDGDDLNTVLNIFSHLESEINGLRDKIRVARLVSVVGIKQAFIYGLPKSLRDSAIDAVNFVLGE